MSIHKVLLYVLSKCKFKSYHLNSHILSRWILCIVYKIGEYKYDPKTPERKMNTVQYYEDS